MIKGGNFAQAATPDQIDAEYQNCNFSQVGVKSGNSWRATRIFPGDDTPRTFIECNLINCIIPPGSTTIRCNRAVVEYTATGSTVHGRTVGEGSFVGQTPQVIDRTRKRKGFLQVDLDNLNQTHIDLLTSAGVLID